MDTYVTSQQVKNFQSISRNITLKSKKDHFRYIIFSYIYNVNKTFIQLKKQPSYHSFDKS